MALFEDVFEILDIDKDGKLFDKVSRVECRSDDNEDIHLSLDYNCEIFKLKIGKKFDFVLRSNLQIQDESMADNNEFNQSAEMNIGDDYDYVMYGKIFKILHAKGNKKDVVEIYASFGGLLMCLRGEQSNFDKLEGDARIYLLIRHSA
mmetsp:Transcript_36397/g.58391  ORF Transcript_36397/g.58391 Transcript_36397/m.58391 type:complete len:148 (-) Transcript_36397:148-591(-)|eukprot:CAMPEP_0197024230 /NCGR_PEP_ID=MMETSP1384-20130603/4832_1 /TAXON_ID=29189 /ORGANISM="Ammonia sp." /LENGTH=147 /DNA_ID=CAMNT_0042452579 /DNA_START=50 /DNA_END=493 /DNA_ORIENTATION=-